MFLIKTQASHCLQTWDTFQLRLTYTNRHHAEKTAKCLYYRWRELNLQLKIFEVPLDWYKARFKALCENRTTEKKAGGVKAWPTLATFQRNILQHCWAHHVAYVWPPCCDMLRAFGQSIQHMSQHHTTILQDVALKCCERLARP